MASWSKVLTKFTQYTLITCLISFIVALIIPITSIVQQIAVVIFLLTAFIISVKVANFTVKFGAIQTLKLIRFVVPKVTRHLLLLINITALVTIFAFIYRIEYRLANIENRFGGQKKLKCSEKQVIQELNSKVVRIIGSYAEGSGFPISEDTIITNFHVIEGESSPKIVFPDGTIKEPTGMLGDQTKDFALLKADIKVEPVKFLGWFGTSNTYSDPTLGEPVYAIGYPLGSSIKGSAAVIKGSFSGKRFMKGFDLNVIESDISLVKGMSGGPLVDSCGQVLGINTLGIGGISMFLDIEDVQRGYYDLSSEDITQEEIDTTTPGGVVSTFYIYIKARNLEKAFELLATDRKSSITSFDEWVKGYAQTLQVNLINIRVDETDNKKIFIKLESQDWVDGEMIYKYFEGYWVVVDEAGSFKLNESNIHEAENPSWD